MTTHVTEYSFTMFLEKIVIHSGEVTLIEAFAKQLMDPKHQTEDVIDEL